MQKIYLETLCVESVKQVLNFYLYQNFSFKVTEPHKGKILILLEFEQMLHKENILTKLYGGTTNKKENSQRCVKEI